MRLGAAILILAVALPLAPGGQQMPDGLRRNPGGQVGIAHFPDTNDWLLAAAQHEPGELDDAARRVATWTSKRLLKALEGVSNLRPSAELNAALARGAMLHTDIWLLTNAPLPPPLGQTWDGEGPVTLLKDGSVVGHSEIAGHVAFARRSIMAMRGASTPWKVERFDPRVSQWFRAVAAVFAVNLWVSDLLPHQRRARQAFPDHPGILFDSACAAETLAAPAMQAGVPGREVAMSNDARRKLSVPFNLDEAERYYRAALEQDPTMHEARVRLARVLARRGDGQKALALLTGRRQEAEPIVEYFAAVVLADVLDDEGRSDEAIDAYRRASALYPLAQSPYIGISRIARERGDLPAAREAMARLASLSSASDRPDAWWEYNLCAGRNAELELGRLRYAFRTSGLP